jgi:hypothetical protein
VEPLQVGNLGDKLRDAPCKRRGDPGLKAAGVLTEAGNAEHLGLGDKPSSDRTRKQVEVGLTKAMNRCNGTAAAPS